MESYRQGEYIRTERLLKKMSQEDLAEGTMTRPTLSKIENGQQAISKANFEALMQKLGKDPNSIPLFLLDGKAEKIHGLKDSIDTHLNNRQHEQADLLITELEELAKKDDDAMLQQYLLLVKVASVFQKQQVTPETLKTLQEALSLGNAKFEEKNILKYNLTAQDIKGINLLSIYYDRTGQLKKAIKVLEQLEKNLSTRLVDKEEKGRRYPLIAYNLSGYLIRANNFYKGLKYSELGLEVCKKSKSFFFSPHLIMNKVVCLFESGEIEICRKLIKEAYYMFGHYGLDKKQEEAKVFAKEKLDLLLD